MPKLSQLNAKRAKSCLNALHAYVIAIVRPVQALHCHNWDLHVTAEVSKKQGLKASLKRFNSCFCASLFRGNVLFLFFAIANCYRFFPLLSPYP